MFEANLHPFDGNKARGLVWGGPFWGNGGWRLERVVEEGRGCSDDGGAQSSPAPRLRWKQGVGGRVRLSVSGETRVEVVWGEVGPIRTPFAIETRFGGWSTLGKRRV